MGPEAHIEKQVCQYAQDRGWLALKLTSPGTVGVPDRMLIGFKGKVLFIEFKAPGKEPRPSQVRMVNKFKIRDVTVHVIDDIEKGRRLIDAESW